MIEPKDQHLYVMQNEFGCIKIGRSIDPWKRLTTLRHTEHCRVELVAAFEGGGEDEEAIHIELNKFRLAGEWFEGCDAARVAIQDIFDIEPGDWKFTHDPQAAENWLELLWMVRDARYIRNALTREIVRLRAVTEPSWVFDCGIFFCRYLAETGERPALCAETQNGRTVNTWHNPQTERWEALPNYTASTEEALHAWPDDLRPARWEGSPVECCIAALSAIRSRLPKAPR